jgi:3-hydroxyisobutyrate dehydrogenase-like beta-hydroxyacid dehydrogenase
MKVAFLGLGIMGGPMAANLVKAGHDVTVWNRSPGKTITGARVASSPAEAAKGCEVVWTCVSDTAAVEHVLFGPSGVVEVLTKGMIVVDSSTILPSASKDFAGRIKKTGADFVDAPVTGSKLGAESGQLVFIAGGEEATIAKLKPLLSAMGKQTIHIGANGLGESAKIGMNLMIALIFEGFAEALTLTQKLGVDPAKFLELVGASMVRSGVTDAKGPLIQKRDFAPHFPLRLMHKDIKLMLEAGANSGTQLPGLKQVEQIYAQAANNGQADLDYAATIEVLEKMSGIK